MDGRPAQAPNNSARKRVRRENGKTVRLDKRTHAALSCLRITRGDSFLADTTFQLLLESPTFRKMYETVPLTTAGRAAAAKR